jgi:sugar lactone lactonase YvrE
VYRLLGIASLVAVLLDGGIVMAWGQGEAAQGTPAQLLVAFPDNCNTPDGMSLQPDNSIIVSMPNFNDEKSPPLLMRVTPENRAEVFYKFPTPYPGLQAPVDRIAPMGICRAPSGDLYLADMQYMKDKNQKSRLWRLVVKDGRVERMVLVASGFNVANGTAIHGGHLYVTESVLEEGFNPTLKSAVLRFNLNEENLTLKTPLRDDPHVITTFVSHKQDWAFGADGIALDSKGNLFVGLFGDGKLFKVELDAAGNVRSNRLFAEAPFMKTCDGMSCDLRTDKLYLADSATNSIQVVGPDGSVTTLSRNGDFADKRQGHLDQPCEALVRGNTIVVSNMDWPFPKFVNAKWQMPATLSVIPLKDEPAPKGRVPLRRRRLF